MNIDLKASKLDSRRAIDVRKLSNGDMEELLKLAFQLDEHAVKRSFSEAGFELKDYNDIALLAQLHNTGGDINGALKNKFGNRIIFSVEKTLHRSKSNFNDKFKEKQLNLKWK